MIRDIPEEKFEKLGSEAKKKYVVSLIIKDSGAKPVPDDQTPVAIVMAGIPGAGKTEFLDSIIEELEAGGQINEFVRIDLDQIVAIYPGYTPKTDSKFRSQGNNVLARSIDELRRARYNILIDGTFSGASGSSVRNVEKLLNAGYRVSLVYMYDKAEVAWSYTKSREKVTDRGIGKDDFLRSCSNISGNLKSATLQFKDNPNFTISVVKQKELRDKYYDILTSLKDVDKIINEGYNIDNLKETL